MPWSVISAAGADLQVFFYGCDLDRVVTSVGVKVGGLVGDVVLAAQFVFNGGERVRNILHFIGKESAAAGRGRQVFKNFVAPQNQAAVVGGDGINKHFGALRHFNRLGAGVFALIVLAVTEDHNRFAHGMVGLRVIAQQLFLARLVDCVVERGAAAVAQALHSGGKQWHLIGEILGQVALFVEPYDEGAVIAGANNVLQKSRGSVFFESETALHRAAHVHEQAEFDGQVGLAAEVKDRLHRLVVIKNREIVLVQIADELAVAIGGDEQHVDFIDALLDGEDGFVHVVGGGNRGRKSSGAAGSGDHIGTVLSASGDGQTQNGTENGAKNYDAREYAGCESA